MERDYVGIDLHCVRSVIVRKAAVGGLLSETHIDNDPIASTTVVGAGGLEPDGVESWRWLLVGPYARLRFEARGV
jgi:hypothetical protein